jgi:hypothetical protein
MSRRMQRAAGNNLIQRQQAERKLRFIQRDAATPAEDDGMVILRRAGLYSRTNHVEEVLVEAEIVGKLRVECGGEPSSLAGGNGSAVCQGGDDACRPAGCDQSRGTNEYAGKRTLSSIF